MAKTTVVINDNIQRQMNEYIKKKNKTVQVSIRTVVNTALDKYFNDISNKKLLEEIKKLNNK